MAFKTTCVLFHYDTHLCNNNIIIIIIMNVQRVRFQSIEQQYPTPLDRSQDNRWKTSSEFLLWTSHYYIGHDDSDEITFSPSVLKNRDAHSGIYIK